MQASLYPSCRSEINYKIRCASETEFLPLRTQRKMQNQSQIQTRRYRRRHIASHSACDLFNGTIQLMLTKGVKVVGVVANGLMQPPGITLILHCEYFDLVRPEEELPIDMDSVAYAIPISKDELCLCGGQFGQHIWREDHHECEHCRSNDDPCTRFRPVDMQLPVGVNAEEVDA